VLHSRLGTDPTRAADALRRLVDLVSHRSGSVFALMNDASVTLPQVLLVSRVQQFGSASLSDLVEGAHASPAAVSQMIERLVQLGMLYRVEDPSDRRRKAISVTPRADTLLRKLKAARSADYALGLAAVSPELLAQMAFLLDSAVAEIKAARAKDRTLPGHETKTKVAR
jgi:DNA-binding MarR family transcriptional regulator